MRTFRFYSATVTKKDGSQKSGCSDIESETFEEAMTLLKETKVIFDDDIGVGFIPVYFEEIGNLSGKAREK